MNRSHKWNKKYQITIFDRKVSLGTPTKRSGHEQPFVKIIDVEKLHCVTAKNLSKTEMKRCVNALMSLTHPSSTLEGAIQLFVFTTDEDGSPSTISLNKTHAFSILTYQDERLEHHYFEKQSVSSFQKVPSLSMPLSGPFDVDDVRLLHFAASGKHGLPLKSTIYEFNSGAWGYKAWLWEKNIPLRVSLLQDPERNWGAPTLGLYGNEVYLALGGATQDFCGGDSECPEGTDSTCGYPPGGPDKVCGEVPPQGDIFVDILRAFMKQAIVSAVPIDFVLLKSLRKNFLMHYTKGRDYISYYYIAALFTRLDSSLLEKYAKVIPHFDKVARELLSGSDETVIITTPLRDLLLDIIQDHRDVQNREFQDILDILEKDLRHFHLMKKGQLVNALS